MMTMIMVTDDGWKVELMITTDGPWFRVTQDGYLAGPGSRNSTKDQGLYRTIAEVQAIMGESFARLAEPNLGPKTIAS